MQGHAPYVPPHAHGPQAIITKTINGDKRTSTAQVGEGGNDLRAGRRAVTGEWAPCMRLGTNARWGPRALGPSTAQAS